MGFARTIPWALSVTLVGCASAPPERPGTGDIAFRLRWDGPADLDLHVRTPLNEEIFYSRPTSSSGGLLDRDCNATPETMCAAPLENIFWPRGRAPHGSYYFSVKLVNVHGAEFPIAYTVDVLKGARLVMTRSGRVSGFRETVPIWDVTFGR